MIVSPSAQSFMATTLFGMPDFRNLGPYMQKPGTALTMSFTDDPQPGMASEKFAGSAVAFISSVKFAHRVRLRVDRITDDIVGRIKRASPQSAKVVDLRRTRFRPIRPDELLSPCPYNIPSACM